MIIKSVTLLRINELEKACYDKALFIGVLKETNREYHEQDRELKNMLVQLKDMTHKFLGTKEIESGELSFNEQVNLYNLKNNN